MLNATEWEWIAFSNAAQAAFYKKRSYQHLQK